MKLSASTGRLMPVRGFSRSRAPSTLITCTAWIASDGLYVTSDLADMPLPGGNGKLGPTWLLSASFFGRRRPADDDMQRVIDCFALDGWEEDNHFPGATRSLFIPVDPKYRSTCECKLTETIVVEGDGYEWTNPTDGPCRGCEHARMTGRDCPLHGKVVDVGWYNLFR